MLKSLLSHPLTKGLDIDDPRTTFLRRQIIREKPFLKKIYDEWYGDVLKALPETEGAILEIGSGAGSFSEFLPVITSDILPSPGVKVVLDGHSLPFSEGVLRGIVLVNVLHHLPGPRLFLMEAARCVTPGGKVIMVEPWVTAWSSFIYRRFHHEPFDPESKSWEFDSSGPLTGANGALAWMIFDRDREQFEYEFPEWRVEEVRIGMPFRYLVSGGVSLRNLMPEWSFGFWRALESFLEPVMGKLAMFAFIVLLRVGNEGPRRISTCAPAR